MLITTYLSVGKAPTFQFCNKWRSGLTWPCRRATANQLTTTKNSCPASTCESSIFSLTPVYKANKNEWWNKNECVELALGLENCHSMLPPTTPLMPSATKHRMCEPLVDRNQARWQPGAVIVKASNIILSSPGSVLLGVRVISVSNCCEYRRDRCKYLISMEVWGGWNRCCCQRDTYSGRNQNS